MPTVAEQRAKTLVQTTVAYETGIAAERERCAKIVESWKETPGLHNMLDSIAAAIRGAS